MMFIQSLNETWVSEAKKDNCKKSYFRNNEHIWLLNVCYISVQHPNCDIPHQTKEQVLM